MTKIGRNEPCPCGSGNKYKKCCLNKETEATAAVASAEQPRPALSLKAEVAKAQQAAMEKRYGLHTLGVFIFFTTETGDGWVLEISEMDALQIAKGGQKIEVEIEESEETIEVNWSHKFSVKNNVFQVTDYKTKETTVFDAYPGNRLAKAVKQCRSRFPQEMLEQVHVQENSAA